MKRWLAALTTFSLFAACKPVVLDVVEPTPIGNTTSATAVSTGTGSEPLVSNVFAVPGSMLPDYAFNGEEADTLVLLLGNDPQTCGAFDIHQPMDVPPPCDPTRHWQLVLRIPPELNRVGLIDLRDSRIVAMETSSGPDCSVIAASANMGVLEITSSDAASVHFTLKDVQPMLGLELDGDYVAPRCGPAPETHPRPQVTPILGSKLDPSLEPDSWYVYGSDAGTTCANPTPQDCLVHRDFAFVLPPELRQLGKIDLQDPHLGFVLRNPYTACSPVKAAPGGWLEIDSIDAAEVGFHLFGSNGNVDGWYIGTLCP